MISSEETFRGIEEEVLKRIKPRKEEYDIVWYTYRKIESIIKEVLEKYDVKAEVSLQGSIKKDTWISGERDLDIFVLFPKEWSREELEHRGFRILLEVAKSIGRYSINYAEHPYIRVFLNGIKADIVPAFKIDRIDRIKSAVDRTPFHTEYIIKNLPPDKRDDVRLLKKFMRAIGVYGAEVKVKGFSGYLVELLIITYNGFRNVLKHASKWRPPVYINTLGLKKREFHKLINMLKRKYPNSVMYAPDPVDPERNVAAAVSLRSLATFSLAASCYLRNPSVIFFFPTKTRIEFNELANIVNQSNRCIIFMAFGLHRVLPPDVIWGEMDRIMDRFIKIASNFDFRLIYSSRWSDEERFCIIGFEFEDCSLKEYRFHGGPPFHSYERVIGFIRKHYKESYAGPWVDNSGHLHVLIKRKYKTIYDLILDRVNEYLVAPDFRNNPPILLSIEGLYRLYSMNKGFREWLVDFVLRKPAWMENCIV